MTDTIEKARALLQQALAELDLEERQLRRAVDCLLPDRVPRHPARKMRAPRRRAKRAPAGQRQEQLLEAIAQRPGAPVSELAPQIGISATYAHSLMRKLEAAQAVVKDGKGFAVAKKRTRPSG